MYNNNPKRHDYAVVKVTKSRRFLDLFFLDLILPLLIECMINISPPRAIRQLFFQTLIKQHVLVTEK